MHLSSFIALAATISGYLWFLKVRFSVKRGDDCLGVLWLGIFAIICIPLIDNPNLILPYLVVCFFWLALSVEDLVNTSVSLFFLIVATIVNVFISYFFYFSSLNELAKAALAILAIRILLFTLELALKKQMVGGADYFAAFAFAVTIPIEHLSYWLICFSSFGIIHRFSGGKQNQKIPLIPFMTTAWCLIFTISY